MKKSVMHIPAPLWKRAFAYIIDLLVLSLIVYLPLGGMTSDFESVKEVWSSMQSELTKEAIITSMITIVLVILYWSILEYKTSQSIGKMLMRIKVVSTTKELTFLQCIYRNLTKMSMLILFLDVLYMIKSGSHRFFDTLSKTEVVEVKQG